MNDSICLHGFSNQGLARFEGFLQEHTDGMTTAQVVQMSADCLTALERSFNEGVAFPVWEMGTKTGEVARFIPRLDDLIIE